MDLSKASGEQIINAAAKLYLEYGKGERNLISDEGERALERESDDIDAFVAIHLSSIATVPNAARISELEVEYKRLAVSFYTTLVRFLPKGAV